MFNFIRWLRQTMEWIQEAISKRINFRNKPQLIDTNFQLITPPIIQVDDIRPGLTPDETIKDLPAIGLGTFQLGTFQLRTPTDTILESFRKGYRHLDLAQDYQNIVSVGKALKQAMEPVENGGLGLKRQDFWITLKTTDMSVSNIKALLTLLGVQQADLLLEHFSYRKLNDSEAAKNMWTEMSNLVTQGYAKYIGVSNCYPPHLKILLKICEEHALPLPYANEVETHPIHVNQDTVDFCHEKNIKVIGYSPLGFSCATVILQDPTLITISDQLKATPAQTLLAWHLKRGVHIIPKSDNSEHLEQNIKCYEFEQQLTDDLFKLLSNAFDNYSNTPIIDVSQYALESAQRIDSSFRACQDLRKTHLKPE